MAASADQTRRLAAATRNLQVAYEHYTTTRKTLMITLAEVSNYMTTDADLRKIEAVSSDLTSATQNYRWAKDSYDSADREVKYAKATDDVTIAGRNFNNA